MPSWTVTARTNAFQQQRGISHIQKNEKLGRPVSPHVTIYAFPLAAITSVTHRITGGLLTIGMYSVGIGALLGMDTAHMMYTLGQSGLGPLIKMSVAFPLSFHLFGGLRHLYWEKSPEGLNPETQRQASIFLLGAASAVTLVSGVL